MTRKFDDKTPSSFHAFADDSTAVSGGGVTVENGTDRLVVTGDYGSMEIPRDARGLAACATLLTALKSAVKALEADRDAGNLPEARDASVNAGVVTEVKNPFG